MCSGMGAGCCAVAGMTLCGMANTRQAVQRDRCLHVCCSRCWFVHQGCCWLVCGVGGAGMFGGLMCALALRPAFGHVQAKADRQLFAAWAGMRARRGLVPGRLHGHNACTAHMPAAIEGVNGCLPAPHPTLPKPPPLQPVPGPVSCVWPQAPAVSTHVNYSLFCPQCKPARFIGWGVHRIAGALWVGECTARPVRGAKEVPQRA